VSRDRARARRIFWIVHGTTALAHVLPGLALGVVLAPGPRALTTVLLWLAVALRLQRLGRDLPRPWWHTRLVDEPLFVHWGACLIGSMALVPAAALVAGGVVTASWSSLAAILYAGAGGIAAWSVWGRRRRVRAIEVEVPIGNLPPPFEGYRIAHLSDLHIGSYDRRRRGLAWAALARRLRPDLVAVTGDLVTQGVAFYPDVAEVIGALEAPDGVFVSLGNHDQWDAAALTRAMTRRGAAVLHNEARVIRRGTAELLVAGLGDRYSGNDDLERALGDVRQGRPTVLLAHYPTFFERAADLGADLVLSGHTHGGQVGVPPFAARVNFATLTGQRGRGLYRRGHCHLYVSAGLGTTGPPMRLGVAPEIAVLVLRRAEGSAPVLGV
jgi:uncharacterized protein